MLGPGPLAALDAGVAASVSAAAVVGSVEEHPSNALLENVTH